MIRSELRGLEAIVLSMLINNPAYCMPSGPNLDLHGVFYEYSEGEGYGNIEISRHLGTVL